MGLISANPTEGYEHAYSDRCVMSRGGELTGVNKLKLAKAAMTMQPNVGVLDLRDRLKELAAFIREACRKNI
jgi:hypothetical protein